jgi:hypothetical protein
MCGLSFFGVVLYRYAARARDRVGTWRRWNRAWGEMSGSGGKAATKASDPPARRTSRRGRIAFGIWVILALWLRANAGSAPASTYNDVAMGFGALTLWGAGAILLRLVRRKPAGKTQKAKDAEFVVRVIPGIPRVSPSQATIRSSLPAYCKRLMTGGAAPT